MEARLSCCCCLTRLCRAPLEPAATKRTPTPTPHHHPTHISCCARCHSPQAAGGHLGGGLRDAGPGALRPRGCVPARPAAGRPQAHGASAAPRRAQQQAPGQARAATATGPLPSLPSLPSCLPTAAPSAVSPSTAKLAGSAKHAPAPAASPIDGGGSDKGSAAADLEAQGGRPGGQGGSSLPFTPVRMAFQDIRYSVPFPKVRVCCGRCCGCCCGGCCGRCCCCCCAVVGIRFEAAQPMLTRRRARLCPTARRARSPGASRLPSQRRRRRLFLDTRRALRRRAVQDAAHPEGSDAESGPHAGQLLLLKGITGSFRGGVLTALMGASGAGKTVRGGCAAGEGVAARQGWAGLGWAARQPASQPCALAPAGPAARPQVPPSLPPERLPACLLPCPCLPACVLPQTLMDVLAGRKTGGTITGDVRVNGFPKEPHTFARIMG